jgi:hypothetical protein
MLSGYKCIAERYIIDTVVTIAYFTGDMGFLTSRISRLLFYFIPTDTLFIFLDSDYGTISRRRSHLRYEESPKKNSKEYGALPKSAVEPEEFIDFQRIAYRKMADSFKAIKIDTSDLSIQQTTDQILAHICGC